MTQNKRAFSLSFSLFALLLIGFKLTIWSAVEAQPITSPTPKKTVWLNVFVHGIMSIKPHLSWNNFMLFMKDKIEGTLYEKTVELMREDPFFYRNQAMQQLGLHQINAKLKKEDPCANLAYILDKVLHHYDVSPHENRYYTFGWTGLLSAKTRYKGAKQLFKQLSTEVAKLKAQNIEPRIRVFGYSHGGNVGLNLAQVREKEYPHSTLSIDELVLLGSPIIKETDYLINDPIFKQVYNIYSLRDRVQPLDIFARKQTFSKRVFHSRKNFKLPDKLIQIQLKVTRCKKDACKDPVRYARSLDLSNRKVVLGKSGLLRDMSPGHMELWFFGWTPMHYRSSYPLYPLPTIALTPPIMKHAKKLSPSFRPEQSIIADIRPEHEIILFRKKGEQTVHSTIPYLPKDELDELDSAIHACEPELYSKEMYKAHVRDAISSARKALEISRSNEP